MRKRNYVFPAIIERDKISAIEREDFIQAYYWAGPRLGFHL